MAYTFRRKASSWSTAQCQIDFANCVSHNKKQKTKNQKPKTKKQKTKKQKNKKKKQKNKKTKNKKTKNKKQKTKNKKQKTKNKKQKTKNKKQKQNKVLNWIFFNSKNDLWTAKQKKVNMFRQIPWATVQAFISRRHNTE